MPIVRFGPYEVDLSAGQIRKAGVKINLRGQSFQVLATLLEHPSEVVMREELQRRLWRGNVFVDFENNLNTAVARLREALCDSPDHPRFIETVPRRGYRFIASVSETSPTPKPVSSPRPRLIVLPFLNLSGDPGQEYFSDAITDEIITALVSLAPEQLAVIARTTAMHYKGSHKDVARIGRELNVDYVVEGGVRRSEDQVAINVQLIQVSDQSHLFAKKYEIELHELFTLQNTIAQALARNVPAIAVTGAAAWPLAGRRRGTPTSDLVAYNLYIQGRYLLERDFITPENFANAKNCFEAAVARDPAFALAYHSLADLYYGLSFMGFLSPKEALATGIFHALHALEIDNSLAETHALLAMCRVDYDWAEIRREMNRALQLNAALPVVRLRNAIALFPHGRLEEAIAEIERGLEVDPLSLFLRCWLAVMHWLGRHYERAVEEVRRVLEVEPNSSMAHLVLGQTRCMEGKFEDAITALRKAVELYADAPTILCWLGLALAQSGNEAEARALLDRLHAMVPQLYVPPTSFAWIHLGLGEIDDAFAWMDRAVEARDHMIIPIKSYPFLDPLRADPRFAVLLRKMNLGEETVGGQHFVASAASAPH